MEKELLNTLDLSALDGLSDTQKQAALQILQEYAESGSSKAYENLLLEDYAEMPVDILTFVDDYNYLGNAWHDADGNSKLYPYWRKELIKIFPDNLTTAVNNGIFSGSRGRGKSEICSLIAAYLLHRILCLKDPIAYFHLKPTEKIVFAFMNIKLELAEEIGVAKFQNTLKSSPWFMAHGTLEGRTKKIWVPQKYKGQEAIDIKIGSQADDVIGLPIYFCLDGNTPILTSDGIFKIEDLAGKEIKVFNVTEDGEIKLSEACTVMQTAISDVQYEIELEDGSLLRCTPSHRFLLKDGTYKEAQDLTEDDELWDIKPFGYVYKFTNTVTNKIYIGKREKSKFDESYYGSGKKWQEDLKKYGKESIKREILCFASSRSELNALEKKYIREYDSQNPNIGYNIHRGGQGGNSLNNTALWSELHRGSRNGRYGKAVAEETRMKISAANKGRGLGIKNPKKGRPGVKKPEGFGAKISEYQKNRIRSAEELEHCRLGAKKSALKNKGKIIYNNGINEIRVPPESVVPPGYVRGRIKSKLKSNLPKNYHWFNNGKEAVYCADCPEGFHSGRKLTCE